MQAALGPFFDRARLRITMRTDDAWGGPDEQRAYLAGLRAGELERVGGRAEWASRVDLVEGRRKGEPVVSSTAVRTAVSAGDLAALDELVSPSVKTWLLDEELYSEA